MPAFIRRNRYTYRRFSPVFLEEQLSGQEEEEKAFGQVICGGAARPVLEREISAWEAVGEGGVLAALWNFSGKMDIGIEFDLKKIPLRQITVEVCELFHLNPYRLLTSDAFVAAADNGGRAVRALEQLGIPAAVIGRGDGGDFQKDVSRRRRGRFFGEAPAGRD